MLGIEKYELNYLNSCDDVIKLHKQTFNALIGKSIDSYFVQWEKNENKWNEDGPIIILIDGKQYEFTAYQLEYSLTINKIDLSDPLDWYGSGDEMPLEWKKNTFKSINSILNKPITKIYGLEYGQEPNSHFVGFELEFDGINDCLHISNGLDCNTMKLHRTIADDRNKRIEIKK
ncbi:hypothetical protein [Aquimarina sp. MMG016]|uniref:hypothetical protein n=1 Tax=Aquimarina sp. MMG016 TaxID=2822690 RepID=UPI001B3A2D10|nr:hypothetical protein [Aquimarina sp. MMG016]MBQ4820977.1 hypothetical protein [Aquimarina sp. MMG016]